MTWEEKFVQNLLKAFPGLKDGKTEVNGGDLVDWISEYLAGIKAYIRRKHR